MLTREAFNALLKTLEEPPAHVVFILATTEVHKLPETIISRTQRYAFKPVEETKVVEHLKHIAKQEGIKIDDAALQLIALHGEGSFRDSISLLDQIRHAGTHITLQEVQTALGIAPLERIDSLLDALQNHDASAVVAQLQTLREGGFEPAQLARQLSEKLRSTLIQGEAALGQHEAMRLLARLVEVPASFDPHTSLEIALIDTALAGSSTSPIEPAEPKPHKTAAQTVHHTADDVQIEPHPSTFQKAQKKDEPANQKQPKATKPPKPEQNSTTAAEPDSRALTQEQWQQTLNTIKKKYNTLHSVLKASQAAFTPGTVRITCSNTFYKKRVSEARNKQIVCDTVQELFGLHVDMQCEQGTVALAETPPPLPPADGEIIRTVQPAEASAQPPQETTSEKPANESLKTINNIFGSSEVLES